MDEFTSYVFTRNIATTFEMRVNKAKNTTTTIVFSIKDSISNLVFSLNRQTQSNICGENVVDNNKTLLMDVPTSKHNKIN